MSDQLDELIRKGVSIYHARLEAERKRHGIDALADDHIRQEIRQQVLALLPQATWDMVDLKIESLARAQATIRLPHGGEVHVHFEKQGGQWRIYSPDDYLHPPKGLLYDAVNPKGVYQFFTSIEEALAYAAGAIDVAENSE